MNGSERTVGIDDVVAAATTGVLRAFEARKIGAERLTVRDLVQSGYLVKFEIWAGGLGDIVRGGGFGGGLGNSLPGGQPGGGFTPGG